METTVKFILIADATQFNAALKTASTQLKTMGAVGEESGKKVESAATRSAMSIKKIQGVVNSVVTSLAVIGTMTVFSRLIAEGAKFDLAFTGITKTVKGTATDFSNLKVKILEMSSELPFAATEIAKVGQIAGQLGIGVKDIAEFTRVVLDLSVAADDLNSEEAALALARLGKLAGIAVTDTKNLAASIVQVSNVTATTEGEITALALRLMAMGRTAGMTAPDVIAMSASLTQLGIRADAGGTAMSKAIATMRAAVDKGGADLAKFAKVAGMSSEAFASSWEERPVVAMNQFVTGLGRLIASGGNATRTLNELGLADIRVSRVIMSAASAQGEFNRILEESNAAYREGTASQREAEKFYNAFINKLSVAWNQIKRVFIETFDAALPLLDVIVDLTNWILRAAQAAKVFQTMLGLPGLVARAFTDISNLWANSGRLWDAFTSFDTKKWWSVIGDITKGIKSVDEAAAEVKVSWKDFLEDLENAVSPTKNVAAATTLLISEYKDLAAKGGDVSTWFSQNRDQIEKLITQYDKFGGDTLPGSIEYIKQLYLELAKASEEERIMSEEMEKLIDKFEKSLVPMDALLPELKKLQEYYSDEQILAVYADEIIRNTEAQLANGESVSKAAMAWYEWADAIRDAKDPAKAIEEMAADLDLVSQGMGTAESDINQFKDILNAAAQSTNDFGRTVPRNMGLAFDDMKDPKNPIKSFVEEFQKMQTIIPNVSYMIDELTKANIPASAQAQILASEIAAAEQASQALGVALPEPIRQLINLGKATKESESQLKRVQRMVDNIVSQTFSDFTNAIADAIVDWKGFGDSLIDIAKSFGKSLIRVMLTELFNPLLGIMKGLGQGLAGLFSGQGFKFNLGGSLLGTGLNSAAGIGTSALAGALGLGGGTAAAGGSLAAILAAGETPIVFSGAGGTILGSTGLGSAAGGAGGGGLLGSLGGFFTNPITAVVGGGLLAGLLGYKAFTNTPSEAFVKEINRDFGGVKIGQSDFKNFLGGLGISENQAAGVRKDLASSPMFLQISYQAAQAQGKVDSFMKSLESIKTSWGTFNFRAAFQEGLDTGKWDKLNDAFESAFGKSNALMKLFGNDLSPLLMQVSDDADEAADSFDNITAALEELRNRPTVVADTMERAVGAITQLKEAGATDQEILQLLGNDLAALAQEATGLGVAIPDAIQALLDLTKTTVPAVGEFDSLLEALDALRERPQLVAASMEKLGNGIAALQGASATDSEILTLLGDDLVEIVDEAKNLGVAVPEVVQRFYDLATAVEPVDTWMLKLSDSMESGRESATQLLEASALLGAELSGFMEELQTKGKSSVESQIIAWNQYGDTLIDHYNTQKTLGLEIDSTVQSIIDWAIEAGKLTVVEGGLVKVTEDVAESAGNAAAQLTKFEQAMKSGETQAVDLLDSSELLSNTVEGFYNKLLEKGLPALQAQTVLWGQYGSQIVSNTNQLISYGLTVDSNIISVLDWAVAAGEVKVTEKGLYEVIQKGTDILNGNTGAIETRTAAYLDGIDAANSLFQASGNLGDQLEGFGQTLINNNIPALQAQNIAWAEFGDAIIDHVNKSKELGLEIDWRIQQAYEWAVATGKLNTVELDLNGTIEDGVEIINNSTDAIKKHTDAFMDGVRSAKALTVETITLADEIQGFAEVLLGAGTDAVTAQNYVWGEFGNQILNATNVARTLGLEVDWRIQQMIDWAVATGKLKLESSGLYSVIESGTGTLNGNTGAIGGNKDALDELTEAYLSGRSAADSFLGSSFNLAEEIQGFGQQMLDRGIPALDAQNIAWKKYGEQILEQYNNDIKYGQVVDWRIQQMIDWAAAIGYVVDAGNGLYEVLVGIEGIPISGVEAAPSAAAIAFDNLKDSLLNVNEVYEFGNRILVEGSVDLEDQAAVLRAQTLVWQVYGSKILDTAELQKLLYGQMDAGIRGLLEWALASDTVTDSVKEQIRALLDLTDAYGEMAQVVERTPADIVNNVLGKGGVLDANSQASFANTAYYYAQEAASVLKGMGITPDFSKLKSDITRAATAYGDPNKFELVSEAIAAMTPNFQFRDAFSRLSGLPSFQTGISYVPQNTLAYLHQGERVVPAEDNYPSVTNVFEIKAIDGADVERVVRTKIIPELRKQSQLRRF